MRLARIAAIVLLVIILVSTVSCSSNEQPNLDGIYEESEYHNSLVKFEGDTVIFDYQNHQNNPEVDSYYVSKYSIPDGIEDGSTILITNAFNDTYTYYFEYQGNCLTISDSLYCKAGTENVNNRNNDNIATYSKDDFACTTDYAQSSLIVILTPTDNAVANVNYIVDLYEEGNYRTSATVEWNQPELNIYHTEYIYFPLSWEEYQAYSDCMPIVNCYLSDVFTVTVHQ